MQAMRATHLEVEAITSVITAGSISPSPKLLAIVPIIRAIEGTNKPAIIADIVPIVSITLSFVVIWSKNLRKATGLGYKISA
jgi:hypothetical protein